MSPASSTAHAEHRRAPRRAWAARAIESAMHIRVSKIALGWFLAALAIRFLAMLLIHGYSLSAGFGGFYPLASGHDDRGYFHAASQVAANGYSTGDIPNVYPIVLGWWLSITGVEVVWGKMLNVLAGSGAILAGVMLTQDLAREQWPGEDGARARRRAAHWCGALLTFYPSAIWYSTQMVKDPILVLLGLWALHLQVIFARRPRLWPVLLWLPIFFGVFVFRSYAAIALAMSLMLFAARYRPIWLIPGIVAAGAGPYLLGKGFFAWNLIQPWLLSNQLENFREKIYSTGGSAAGISLDFSSPLAFASTYLYSLVTAMFGPFLWQVAGATQAIALPEALLMCGLIPLWVSLLISLVRDRKERRVRGETGRAKSSQGSAMLLIFSVLLIAMVALFSDNIGVNTRLRLLPWSAFFVVAALKIRPIRLRARSRRTSPRAWRPQFYASLRGERGEMPRA